MLKLISGTLVGSLKYGDLYIDSDEDEDTSSASSFVNKSDNEHGKKKKECKIPTLPKIARKVARLEKTQLDEKQYIAYEMIACTFLLGLLNDGSDEKSDVIKILKERGGHDQLLMFLTRPAGSGKSTCTAILL
jgi:hypothetical protein